MSDRPGPERPERPDQPERSDLGGLGGLGGLSNLGNLGDLGNLMASAQEALSAQARTAEQVVEGSAGGGVVTVEMNGAGEVQSVKLSPEVVDPDDVEMLQDLIVAALRDAAHRVAELQREALGAFGNLDLGQLGGLGGLGGTSGGSG